MTFGSLLARHTPEDKKTIRIIEATSKKLINAEAAVIFNPRPTGVGSRTRPTGGE